MATRKRTPAEVEKNRLAAKQRLTIYNGYKYWQTKFYLHEHYLKSGSFIPTDLEQLEQIINKVNYYKIELIKNMGRTRALDLLEYVQTELQKDAYLTWLHDFRRPYKPPLGRDDPLFASTIRLQKSSDRFKSFASKAERKYHKFHTKTKFPSSTLDISYGPPVTTRNLYKNPNSKNKIWSHQNHLFYKSK